MIEFHRVDRGIFYRCTLCLKKGTMTLSTVILERINGF